MKLEEQVCSLDLAKKLKRLGVKQESLFYHCRLPGKEFGLGVSWNVGNGDQFAELASAFTVAELGEMMKRENFYSGYSEEDVGWYCQCATRNVFDIKEESTEADARAKMLAYLIENDLLTERVGER